MSHLVCLLGQWERNQVNWMFQWCQNQWIHFLMSFFNEFGAGYGFDLLAYLWLNGSSKYFKEYKNNGTQKLSSMDGWKRDEHHIESYFTQSCLSWGIKHCILLNLSQWMRFPTMWYVRPAKDQISLRIRIVWSEPLLVAWVFYDC